MAILMQWFISGDWTEQYFSVRSSWCVSRGGLFRTVRDPHGPTCWKKGIPSMPAAKPLADDRRDVAIGKMGSSSKPQAGTGTRMHCRIAALPLVVSWGNLQIVIHLMQKNNLSKDSDSGHALLPCPPAAAPAERAPGDQQLTRYLLARARSTSAMLGIRRPARLLEAIPRLGRVRAVQWQGVAVLSVPAGRRCGRRAGCPCRASRYERAWTAAWWSQGDPRRSQGGPLPGRHRIGLGPQS